MLRHLRALLQEVDVYRWRVVREYHVAWLQLLEQGQAMWKDEGERTELRRLMVWSILCNSTLFKVYVYDL